MATVILEKVAKRFSGDEWAVDHVSLVVKDGEFLVLVGPSGCGKSTTLRLIAGLEACTSGTIRIGDHVVNDVVPKDRDVAMVFQNYALYPHMTVYDNLAFGLRLRYGGGRLARGLRRLFQPGRAVQLEQLRGGIDQQVRQTAVRLGIDHLLDRKPHQLSGGERQRVALGRAIVRNPAAFLFDEPLSNLDAKLRQNMRVELKRLHRQMQATMVYVTHDQVEAMTLGDRVAVMNQGRIHQVATPLEVYRHPADLFVARFIGSVPINLVNGMASRRDGQLEFESEDFRLTCVEEPIPEGIGSQPMPVILGFRAEDVTLTDRADEGLPSIARLQVVAMEQLGDSAHVYLQRPEKQAAVAGGRDFGSMIDRVEPDEATEETSVWIARVPSGESWREGQVLHLQLDRSRLLWFDPTTGRNLLREKIDESERSIANC